MTEDEMERSVRRGKVFNYTAFGILVLLLLCAGALFLKYQVDHTFTTEKWLANPSDRMLILQDLLTDHGLVGLSQEEVDALLGPGEEKTSFSGKLQGTQQGELLVYYLGTDYMDTQWLILHVQEDTVISAVCDAT